MIEHRQKDPLPGGRGADGRRRHPSASAATGIALLAAILAATAGAQTEPPPEPVTEELVVMESSVLLQRAPPARAENLQVSLGAALAEAVAVYRVAELDLPTALSFDLCTTSFPRLLHAVGMVASVVGPLLELGPVSVVASGKGGSRLLLASGTDRPALEAALTVVLRSRLGGCDDPVPPAGLGRLRQALALLGRDSTAPSLLILYGFDHRAISAEDLNRLRPDFARAGKELAGGGRTTVVLLPAEDGTRLEEEEVRSIIGRPEDPPRAIDLGAVLGTILQPRQVVPDDPRLLSAAVDPRNALVRELIAPSQGRVFAFPRQLEAFSRELDNFQILFYRSRRRPSESTGEPSPIEVRSRSGELLQTARFASRPRPAAEGGG